MIKLHTGLLTSTKFYVFSQSRVLHAICKKHCHLSGLVRRGGTLHVDHRFAVKILAFTAGVNEIFKAAASFNGHYAIPSAAHYKNARVRAANSSKLLNH